MDIYIEYQYSNFDYERGFSGGSLEKSMGSSGNISFGLHPLTKDGGAILNKHNSLISILGDSNLDAFKRDWEKFLK